MTLSKSPTSVTVTFSPEEYWLVRYESKGEMTTYTLNTKIDRSFKGKDPDIGYDVLHLLEGQEVVFREAGFEEVAV